MELHTVPTQSLSLTIPISPTLLGLQPKRHPLEQAALPEKEESVLFRWMIVQPLGEACMGPLCPLQGCHQRRKYIL